MANSEVAIEMANAVVEEAAPAFNETHKIATYAPPNSRKTEQIRYLIRAYGQENVGIVSGERGLGTIRGDVHPDMVFNVETWEQAQQSFGWAKERYGRPGTWICVDGASNIMTMAANRHFSAADTAMEAIIMYGANKLNDAEYKGIKAYQRFVTNKGGVLNLDTMAIYGMIGREAERFWGAWKGGPWNLYVNFWQEKCGQSDRERVLPWGPDCPGKMGLAAIKGCFDYILMLGKDSKGTLVANCRADPTFAITKMREDRCLGIEIPDEIQDFRVDTFVEMLTPNTGGK